MNTAEDEMEGVVLASGHKPIIALERRWQPRVSIKKKCLINF